MTFPYLYCYDILPAKQLHLTWYWHKLGRLKYFTILGQRLRQYPVRWLLLNRSTLRLKQNPYHLLLLTGFALILTTFFLTQNRTIDIHVHDTYYVIYQGHIYYFFAFIVWVLWCLYLLTRKVLYSKALTWIHVIITLLTLLFLLFLLNFGGDILNQSPRRYLDASNWTAFNRYEQDKRWITYTMIALFLGQITFIVNLIVGIIKRVT